MIFDDINFSSRPYDPGLAYGQSKTASVLFAAEATRRWSGDGISANAVHPGTIATTNLNGYMGPTSSHISAPRPRTRRHSTHQR